MTTPDNPRPERPEQPEPDEFGMIELPQEPQEKPPIPNIIRAPLEDIVQNMSHEAGEYILPREGKDYERERPDLLRQFFLDVKHKSAMSTDLRNM